MNFVSDVLEGTDPDRLALVELTREGSRREWTFGQIAHHAEILSGVLADRGVHRGDVVMTLIGNRSEWILGMLACFRLGAVVLPATEQLRAKDLRQRLAVASPVAILVDRRNADELARATGDRREITVIVVPDDCLSTASDPPPAAVLGPEDPCLITFTSGTSGEPKAVVHAQRYLTGQRVQATHWLDVRPGDLVWCTAASGWSKSARNVFIAPWLKGAAALIHDARFDPDERLEVIARERVTILCMAPTEYRIIAKRAALSPLKSIRVMVAAGEALNPGVLETWHQATGLWIRDGYGQTETGQMTASPRHQPPRPGSMGKPLPGMSLFIVDGELVADPASVRTFFLGYLDEDITHTDEGSWRIVDSSTIHGASTDVHGAIADPSPRGAGRTGTRRTAWHTGDRVTADEDGFLYFQGRADDVIVSAGYRIGPFEVESALISHPAVVEAAAVSAPDEQRGEVVRAVVVLNETSSPSPALVAELQEHVRTQTAPYKYPRIIDFAAELPKTASGKIKRAELRER